MECPKPFINAIHLNIRRQLTARFIRNRSINGNQGHSGDKSAGGKPIMFLNVGGQLISEETVCHHNLIRIPKSLQKQISQTSAHGITNEQCTCQDCYRSRHAQDYGKVRAPEVSKIAF
jgi:hypothetical protein